MPLGDASGGVDKESDVEDLGAKADVAPAPVATETEGASDDVVFTVNCSADKGAEVETGAKDW